MSGYYMGQYGEGYDAYKTRTDCPYAKNSPECQAWTQGYMHAGQVEAVRQIILKRSETTSYLDWLGAQLESSAKTREAYEERMWDDERVE
jgi:hypothetical protein